MSLFLTVARVSESVFDGEAQSVTLPGTAGEFTVLRGHEPFVTTLKEGTITIRAKDFEDKKIHITNGLVEVTPERTVVLI